MPYILIRIVPMPSMLDLVTPSASVTVFCDVEEIECSSENMVRSNTMLGKAPESRINRG